MTEQKVVVVTGASSGLGRVTAELLAQEGYRVFATTRNPSKGAVIPRVEAIVLDVRDDASVNACVAAVMAQAGRIDALINNAGYVVTGAIEDTTVEQAKALFETNFFGVVRMTKAVLPHMRKRGQGHIINVSSIVGQVPIPFWGIYSASKFAVEGYTEALRHEVKPLGIDVSLIEPGFIRTNLADHGQAAEGIVHDYDRWRQRAIASLHEQIAKATKPALVAKRIARIVKARTPRLRYRAGRDAALVHVLHNFLPEAPFERVWRKQFQLDAV
jgi:NAD(P)-dependent dehydrogenase (short-subunit alcohol dehydrogenase family)